MLKENVGNSLKLGQNDSEEINYKFNTLNMDDSENLASSELSINKKELTSKIVLSNDEKNYNEANLDLIFENMMTKLKTYSKESDKMNFKSEKEKLSKIRYNPFKIINEQYYLKDLRNLKENIISDREQDDKNNLIQISHNVCTGFVSLSINSKNQITGKNLFSTISRVNTNDNWAFKSNNFSNLNNHLTEFERDSDEYSDKDKINKESTFHKSYTHKKRKISKELQLHQEYAMKNSAFEENLCTSEIYPATPANHIINGINQAVEYDLRDTRNVDKKQTVFNKINLYRNEEILLKLKEKLRKIGIVYKQENYHSNYLILFDIPSGTIQKHYELLIQNGNNKILEYKKTKGKEIIVSILNTEESNEKIILEELSSLDKELECSVVNKKF